MHISACVAAESDAGQTFVSVPPTALLLFYLPEELQRAGLRPTFMSLTFLIDLNCPKQKSYAY